MSAVISAETGTIAAIERSISPAHKTNTIAIDMMVIVVETRTMLRRLTGLMKPVSRRR